MEKKLGLFALIATTTISIGAHADSYWGVGYSSMELKTDTIDAGLVSAYLTADTSSFEGIYGFETSPNIAWEARLGLGLGDDKLRIHIKDWSINDTIDGTFSLESYASIYFRPQYKAAKFQIYGLLGYSHINGKMDGFDESNDTSDNGVSYGVGAGYNFSEKDSVNLEWKNLAAFDGGDIEGFTINYQRKF